jgi:hypothetical protein
MLARKAVRSGTVLLLTLSLLLCVATVALWVRGAFDGDQFIFTAGGRLWWVMSSRGSITVICVRGWPRPERFRWVTDNSNDSVPTVAYTAPLGSESKWRAAGIAGENTEVSTWLDEAGTPMSLLESNKPDPRQGGPLHESGMIPCRSIDVPLWMPLAFGGVLPGVLLARGLRARLRRRATLGLCVHCGYDLRASPGCCPECGATTGTGDPR